MKPLPKAMRDQRQDGRVKTRMKVRLPQGHGTVRNVSASGIYFVTDVPFKVGEPLDFELDFEQAGPRTLSARCSARIVRVEKQGRMKGVAAEINRITLYAPLRRK